LRILVVNPKKGFLAFFVLASKQGMISVLKAYQKPLGVTIASF
jgi:hypothetical protein